MKLEKDIQCISLYEIVHPIHKSWMREISKREILAYMPKFLYFGLCGLRHFPKVSQIVSFFWGLFIPSAKIYFIEGPATVPCVYFKKGKVISINSDTFFYNLKHGSWLVRWYSKFLLKRIDGFISTSHMMSRQTSKPSEVVYPFLEGKELFKIKPEFENNNICNVAGIRYTKGTDILITTFKEYKKKHRDAQLYAPGWAGGDSKTGWIKKIKEAGGVAPGFVPVIPYYKKCSIYLNPARLEPFGVNILEAMAAGIPLLVSEFCGAAEIVKKVDKRLIIPLKPKEIIKKINWLKADKKRYYELSKKCKSVVKAMTKEKSNKEFKEKFAKLLGRLK